MCRVLREFAHAQVFHPITDNLIQDATLNTRSWQFDSESCIPHVSRVTTQLIRSFDDIRPQWWDLFARCPDATPFQSPAWLIPWWNCFGRGTPIIVAVSGDERLCGLGLFYLYEDGQDVPQLFFVGKATSDYLDLLIAGDKPRAEAARMILDCAFREIGNWQIADFGRLREKSALLELQSSADLLISRTQEGICPQCELIGSSIKDFIKKSTRDQLRKHRNRARSLGNIEFVTADEGSLPMIMRELIRVHTKQWNSLGQPGVFSDPKMEQFVIEAARQLLLNGILRLHTLLLNGVTVAASLGMLYRDRNYFYLCDFDPDYATISPGTLLTAFAMEQAARQGAEFFDFMQGDERYKYDKWGAQPRLTYRIRMFRSGLQTAA